MDYTWHYYSPLGGITLASDGEALIGLWFDEQKYFASTLATAWWGPAVALRVMLAASTIK